MMLDTPENMINVTGVRRERNSNQQTLSGYKAPADLEQTNILPVKNTKLYELWLSSTKYLRPVAMPLQNNWIKFRVLKYQYDRLRF